MWVQGPDIDRLRLGNYIAAEQRAGMSQLYAPRGGVANASVEPATQKFYGATVLVFIPSFRPTNVDCKHRRTECGVLNRQALGRGDA